ncbi:MAG: protein kinase domain-containing protein [Candidatus Wenzhouxiangella sp. M2_3B_020]
MSENDRDGRRASSRQGPSPDEDATSILTGTGDRSEAGGEDDELKLPGYAVVRPLGSGGMGRVFLARQLEPVDRQVAVKLIRRRIPDPSSEVRFLVERQALAQMQHPAIAQIFEAGTNPEGFPYFAMEYVPGESLLDFCNGNRLDVHARLKLFIRICNGVSHAHQKGIVHRDLKPSNIVVSMIDGVPRPKIIDFGIAVAETSASERRHQGSAGTPVYMSPELFDSSVGIDTRADVYSLGVILCELLCARRPHPGALFKGTQTSVILRTLIERPPKPPSELLVQDESDVHRIARERGSTPRKLARDLKGDLDAIALKAIAPRREQRYASAVELAHDVGNHLQRKPVRAMGDGGGYRFARFVARNAWAVAATAGIMVALAAGLTLALAGMHEARTQQRIAEARSQELERMVMFQQSMLGDLDPRELGEGFVDRLRSQYARSFDYTVGEETVDAGVEAFETAVGRINPTDLAQDLMNEFMLQRAVNNIAADFSDQPRLQAELYETVRDVYSNAGMIERSLPLAERIVGLRLQALGPDATATLHARQQYFRLLSQNGDYAGARTQLDEILERMDAVDPEQLDLRHDTWDSLANLLVNTGDHDAALETARRNLDRAERELGAHHANTVRAVNTIGYVHALAGNMESALEHFRRSAQRARVNFEVSDQPYYSARLNVGAALGALGRYEEALDVEREVSAILSAKYGRRNASTLRVLNNMALTLMDLERFDEATSLLREILELGRDTWGVSSPITLGIQQSLAGLYMRTGDPASAAPLFESTAEWRQRLLGADHPETVQALHDAAYAHLEIGQPERSRTLAERAYTAQRDIAAADGAGPLSSLRLLADIDRQVGNRDGEIRWRRHLAEDLRNGSDAFIDPENVESNVRLLELAMAGNTNIDVARLRTVIERQLRDGGDGGDGLEAAGAEYRELIGGGR